MSLRDIPLKIHYRTNSDNIISDFLIPSLKSANFYSRAVGFFTIDALLSFSEGIINLLRNNGEIRIIASPVLKEADVEIIERGLAITEKIVLERLMEQIKENEDQNNLLMLDIIANLIATERLIIKIAYCPKGIYHEKIGIIQELDGDYIAFNGSLNETYSALCKNIESISVFKSWNNVSNEYANEIYRTFGDLWNNETQDVTVIDFPEAIKENFIKKYKVSDDLESAIAKYQNDKECITTINITSKKLYNFQEKAIEEFVENGYRHFFEMATGTGKTFTAVNAIKRLINDKGKVFVVILVPQIDLQSQWMYELENVGIENLFGIGGTIDSTNWEYDFDASLIEYNANDKPVVYVAVYDSFFLKLSNKLGKIRNLTVIIDEAHNLSSNQINKLNSNAMYRLGLSATPEKHNSEETQKIVEFFIGRERSSFKYSIEEAIQNGFLSRYEYEPIFVYLEEEEYNEYSNITKRIVSLQNQKDKDYEAINRALNERSLIIKKASNKKYKLIDLLDKNYNFKNSVVYCGQGKLGDSDERMIDVVTKILNETGKYRVSTFTSETLNRKQVLYEFKKGFFDVLVAIKCFDEGVDVPQLDKIFIMSSDRLNRQTIQRRGRVLRICKESGKKIAYIYDMVVLPPLESEYSITSKSLVRNELIRVKEYMRLAENKNSFIKEIDNLEAIYGIDEEDYIYEKSSNE